MHAPTRQTGLTLIEVTIASSVLAVLLLVLFQAVGTATQVSAASRAEQEATRAAGRLIERLATELRFADPSTIVFSHASPDRIAFEEVLTYEAVSGLLAGQRRVRSFPVTIRRVPLGGAAGSFAVELSRAEITGGLLAVPVCHLPRSAAPRTIQVPALQLLEHLLHGDTLGPCALEPPQAELLGAWVAATDPEDHSLPGLHFDVRTGARWTHVDITVAIAYPGPRGSPILRRMTTTVSLLNPEPE